MQNKLLKIGIQYIFIVFLVLGKNFQVHAQQPAYFILGEGQFKGIQIYDIIQDAQNNFWIATNEGLYYYDYYTFTKVECEQAKSTSVFNLVANKNGIVYCNNLNNQIFELRNKKCKLFYELKNGEWRSDISLSVSDQNNLVVGGNKIVVIDQRGVVVNQYTLGKHFLGPGFINKRGEIIYHLNSSDSIIVYSHNLFSTLQLKLSNCTLAKQSVLKFYMEGNSGFALDLYSKVKYRYDQTNLTLHEILGDPVFERSPSVRIYETGNSVWVAGTLPGVAFLNSNAGANAQHIWYSDYFISDVYKDHEGNILLATFDKGILVIPDLKIHDVIDKFQSDPIVSLYSDDDFGLLMGSSKGKLLSYKSENLKELNDGGKRPIEAIYGSKNCDLILFDDGFIRSYNKTNNSIQNVTHASLKDAAFTSKNLCYLGTNIGIIKIFIDPKGNSKDVRMSGFTNRVYSIEYDFKSQLLYASTANGLFMIDTNGVGKKLLYNQQDIFPTYQYYFNGKMYVCTNKNGILVFDKNKLVKIIKTRINGKTEPVKKIVFYKNTFIATCVSGIYQFDANGNMLNPIHSNFGFSSNRVIDFILHNEKIWISHSGGVQQIDLDYSNSKKIKPVVRFNKINLNDKEISISDPGMFNNEERKIQFIFSTPSLSNASGIRYYTKLDGYDVNWNANVQSNQITYNALSAGEYTFRLKAENRGIFSDEVKFSFSIASPFYFKAWFLMLMLCLFLLVVWMIYRWQLNRLRKKSQQINELNASKLTAIQSQMNPHFIFNSLNSIQDLILKGDVEHSYSYITTFSNLVRKTLNYSDKDFNDFEEEIKLLELYLSLEKLRFKKDLVYVIEKGKVEDIMLPPLLIQPFIENSLAHGLLHKEGEKALKIKFELKDVLICTIEDNGVGREKARIIQQRQKSGHESFSGKAMQRRFEILSNVFNGQFGFSYEDLYDSTGPSGTRVTIKIPVKRKF